MRKPLMLFGARQVGKSHLLERFATENYQSYALLDLEQSASLRAAFEGDLSPKAILSNLSQLIHAPLPNYRYPSHREVSEVHSEVEC